MALPRKPMTTLAMILAGVLLGGGAVVLMLDRVPAEAAPQPRTVVTRTITVPAAAFHPVTDNFDFTSYGDVLFSNAGPARFVAPLYFEAAEVTVRRLTLYAYDNDMGGDVCVSLYRTLPTIGSDTEMGFICSDAAFLDSVRVFEQQSLPFRRVTGAHGPYLYLNLPGPLSGVIGYKFYDVKVTYTYEAGA